MIANGWGLRFACGFALLFIGCVLAGCESKVPLNPGAPPQKTDPSAPINKSGPSKMAEPPGSPDN